MGEINIGVMKGDFIGPEVIGATLPIVERIGQIAGKDIELVDIPVSGEAWEQTGEHLPDSSIKTAEEMHAILKGPFGGPPNSEEPKWQDLERNAILPLREKLMVYANLRPVKFPSSTCHHLSPLKAEIARGTDIMFVRELTGGIYFGKSGSGKDRVGRKMAYETEYYDESQINRVMDIAVDIAKSRQDKLTLVHKTNVLAKTGKLWSDIFKQITNKANVQTDYMHVDAMAAALVSRPSTFGTVVLPNMFGDILTDEASEVIGSLGLGPSASLRGDNFGLYEPIHGSAPVIAGKDIANPVGTILSAAMMYRHSLYMPEEAKLIEDGVANVLDSGQMTFDLCQTAAYGNLDVSIAQKPVSTSDFGELVLAEVTKLSED